LSGKFLEVRWELTGVDGGGHSRVAVELYWRGERDRIVAAVTFEPCVGIGVGHTPIHDLTDRVVGARQTPRAGGPFLDRHLSPRFATRFAGRRGDIELPYFLAGLGVVGSDETKLALRLLAGAVRDHLAGGDQQSTSCDLAVVDLCFPAKLAGLCIEGDEESVRGAEIEHVFI